MGNVHNILLNERRKLPNIVVWSVIPNEKTFADTQTEGLEYLLSFFFVTFCVF